MQENSERINVSGKMKTLEVGENFELERRKYKITPIRVMAYIMKTDYSLVFTVNLQGDKIKITRIA